MISELLNSARYQLIFFYGAIEVQVEPMGQLDLKTNAYKIGTLLDRYVYDETAGQIIKNIRWDLMVFFVLLGVFHFRLWTRVITNRGGATKQTQWLFVLSGPLVVALHYFHKHSTRRAHKNNY